MVEFELIYEIQTCLQWVGEVNFFLKNHKQFSIGPNLLIQIKNYVINTKKTLTLFFNLHKNGSQASASIRQYRVSFEIKCREERLQH